MHRKGEEIGVTEALADRGGLTGGRVRRFVVAHRLALQCHRHQEVALLGALAALALDEAACAPEPSGRTPHLPAQREIDADEESAPHGAQELAVLEMGVVCAL